MACGSHQLISCPLRRFLSRSLRRDLYAFPFILRQPNRENGAQFVLG